MRFTTLARTGLSVSKVGLGCGGPSRLGQSYGHTVEASKQVIFRALELGINFFDTAESYGTEEVLGAALSEARALNDVIVSTKKGVFDGARKALCTPREMLDGIDASLRRLGRDHIDVFHVHGLALAHVDHTLREIVPALRDARARGKIRHLAVSEAFMGDTRHEMLERVLAEDVFDVVMVGFNLLNPSARVRVLPVTERRGVGTLIMFAVRRALTSPARLREVLEGLKTSGAIAAELEAVPPLGFLGDVRDAAYRFCANEPGADVVLTGTGNVQHLEANIESLLSGPLSTEQKQRLDRLFGDVDSVSGH